jgi:hypothetical protein
MSSLRGREHRARVRQSPADRGRVHESADLRLRPDVLARSVHG